jgi:molybdopterin-guanine dinucleotide biosynthesis protein A
MSASSGRPRIAGVVLAGGGSRRFGRDKAFAFLGGETLLARAIARARVQTDDVVVSVGGSSVALDAVPQLFDARPGEGPLGGVLAGLAWARTNGFDLVATFPCDVPFFPVDIVERLSAGLARERADCAMAELEQSLHPVFGLWRVDCEERLSQAFDAGLRSLHRVGDALKCIAVPFTRDPDAPHGDPFFNVNSVDDLAVAEAFLEVRPPR